MEIIAAPSIAVSTATFLSARRQRVNPLFTERSMVRDLLGRQRPCEDEKSVQPHEARIHAFMLRTRGRRHAFLHDSFYPVAL